MSIIHIEVISLLYSGSVVFEYIKFSDTSDVTFDRIKDGIGSEADYVSPVINAAWISGDEFSNSTDIYTKIKITDDLRPLQGPQLGTIFFSAGEP